MTDQLQTIIVLAANHRNGRPEKDIRVDYAASVTDLAVTSRGAVSINALFRCGRLIGYAVWSCRAQGWVVGSWGRPLTFSQAVAAEKHLPWEG